MKEGKPKSEQEAIGVERAIKEYRQWLNQAIVEAEIRIRDEIAEAENTIREKIEQKAAA
jgi:hypothetical protein